MKHLRFLAWMLLLAWGPLLSGCASVESVRDAPESYGDERILDVSYERMNDVVAKTLPLLGLENVDKRSDDSRTAVFVGTHGVTPASWGEVVRVMVTEVGVARSSAKVYWRSKFRDGVITSAPDWQDDVFVGIEQRLP